MRFCCSGFQPPGPTPSEFGHALGIDGHSADRRDLMYPVHWAGTPARITERDLNTLAACYPAQARRLAAERAAGRLKPRQEG